MLLLLFEIGNGRYALDVNQVIEIVPLVKFTKIPATPNYVTGMMNYRGAGTPVIDLNQFIEAVPFEDALSTRIIIVKYLLQDTGEKPLGLIANNVTETVRTKLTSIPPAGMFMDKLLYEGEVIPATDDMIQWFDINKLLPQKEIGFLFETGE